MKWMLVLLLIVGMSGGLISCASLTGGGDSSSDSLADDSFDDADDFAGDSSSGGGDEFGESSSGGGDEFAESSSGGGDEFGESSSGGGDEFAEDSSGGGDEFAEDSAGGGDEFGEDGGGNQAAKEGDSFDEFAAEDDELTQGVNESGDQVASDEFGDEFGGDQDLGAGGDEFSDQALSEPSNMGAEQKATAPEQNLGAVEQDLGAADPMAEGEMLEGLPEETALGDTSLPEETSLAEMGVAEEAPVAPLQGPPVEVKNISFRAEEAGGTVVIETTGQAGFQVRSKPESRQYIVEIANATLPQKLTRPIITKEFAESQIGSVNAYQTAGSPVARVVVQMKEGATEPVVEQQGNMILVVGGVAQQMAMGGPEAPDQMTEDPLMGEEMMEEAPQEAPQQAMATGGPAAPDMAQQPVYNEPVSNGDIGKNVLKSQTLDEFLASNEKFFGRKINVQVTSTNVTDVLKFIAEQAGLNLVVSSDVEGQIDLKLRDIPWDQALVIVLRSQRLGYHRQGNVLRVAPLAQLRAEAAEAKAVQDAKNQNQSLAVKVISVSYNDVIKLEPQIKKFLSERGQVTADTRTSSLVVTDVPQRIEVVEKLIKSLDIAPPQVLIEGKVVEASDNFTKEFGVNWGFSGSPTQIGNNNGAPVNVTPTLSINPTDGSVGTNGFNFNVNVGTMALLGNLNARLSLFERQAKIKILSSPRVTTLTNEKATINQLTQIPLISSTINGDSVTRGVTFKDVNLSLEVTPQVTVDDSILLDVNILREFAGEIVESETQARPINSRKATTKVLVQNGQTAVIGGVYQSDATEVDRGVPLLRKIPVVGKLFESKSKTNSKNELLIFITPRVLGKSISATN